MTDQKNDLIQRIVGLMFDQGDGSCALRWFKNPEVADKLLNNSSSTWLESTWPNEGGYAEELFFPADLNLEECGFMFSDDMFDDDEND